MDLKNVLTLKELEKKFQSLCANNWKIKKMATELNGNTKDKIDNWFNASRDQLLDLLSIREDENYKNVYYEI